MTGFTEESGGHPFAIWKDHFECDVEDGSLQPENQVSG